jgi:hypothetical protein
MGFRSISEMILLSAGYQSRQIAAGPSDIWLASYKPVLHWYRETTFFGGMMSEKRFIWGSPISLMVASLLLAAAVTLVLTGNSMATEPDANSGADAPTTSSATTISHDSAYALINHEFEALKPIFDKGCNDCHTNRTRYPWYYKIPGIKGVIDDDVRSARRHLDMSSGFPFTKEGNYADELVGIQEEIKGGDMPPMGYRLMHWSAKPSQAEADSIYSWIDRSLKLLATKGFVPSARAAADRE